MQTDNAIARIRNGYQIDGKLKTVGSASVNVILQDSDEKVLLCTGTTKPTGAGYAKGCKFVKTDAVTGVSGVYENVGTTSASSFVLIGDSEAVLVPIGTVPTTGSITAYGIAPKAGSLESVDFIGVEALAANDTNYVTFTLVNKGQAGVGTTAMLAATDANTTKATGGSALVAKGKRALTVHGTAANLVVVKGDVLELTITASGTLANTVTLAAAILRIISTT
ncbi:MAG: hypothetical protein P1P85_04205 [Patescibacteria group bacterium]|nr:hypothetical protein [Patescibacteria group bacterium]